jgi:hypothetical protein
MSAGARLLALVCVALAILVWLELTREPASAPGPGTTAADLPPLPEPPGFEPPSPAAFDLIVLRPLFAPSRRPPEPPSEPAEATPAPPPPSPLAATLIGVTIAGAERAALVATHGTQRWLREGQELDGWQVLTIAPDRVRFRRGDEEALLRLRRDR